MSANTEKYKFEIVAKGPMSEFVHFTLYNGYGEFVDKSYLSLKKELPKGIYKVIIELNEKSDSKFVALDRDIKDFYNTPESSSSIVGDGFETSHEYYTGNAIKWSKKLTSNNTKENGSNGSLFLFFRRPDDKPIKSKNNPTKDFFILDSKRKKLYDLGNTDCIKQDEKYGWMAFHAQLKPGNYYLYYKGKLKRELPLYVFRNWQTQVFLTYTESPVFGSLKIIIERKGRGFQPNNLQSYPVDALVQKIYNGIFFVPEPMLRKLAHEKWENPMAGILASYSYLKSTKQDHDDLFRIVIQNLEHSILMDKESPDIIALKMLAAIHLNEPYLGLPLSSPCMVLSGMRTAIQTSSLQSDTIVKGSIAEKIIENLYSDLVWTSYKPMAITKSKDSHSVKKNTTEKPKIRKTKTRTTKGADTIGEYKSYENSIKKSWVANSIMSYLSRSTENKISISEIAKDLQLTPNIIKQTINKIQNLSTEKTSQIKFLSAIDNSKKIENVFSQDNLLRLKKLF